VHFKTTSNAAGEAICTQGSKIGTSAVVIARWGQCTLRWSSLADGSARACMVLWKCSADAHACALLAVTHSKLDRCIGYSATFAILILNTRMRTKLRGVHLICSHSKGAIQRFVLGSTSDYCSKQYPLPLINTHL
jgi:hypothetical protein